MLDLKFTGKIMSVTGKVRVTPALNNNVYYCKAYWLLYKPCLFIKSWSFD